MPLDGTIDWEDGASDRVSGVDLDQWWGLFAETMEKLAVDSAGEAGERLAGVRRRLAAAMAHRLAPIGPAGDEDGIEELRAVCDAVLTDDLRSRPVLVGAAVDIGRGDPSAEGRAVLSGRAFSPIAAAVAAGGSPAAVRLDAGRRRLAFAAPAAEGPFSIRFEGDRIQSGGAPPLDLVLHAPAETDALALDFGAHSAPSPLIGLPAPPPFSVAATSASAQSPTLAEALQWKLEVALHTMPAEQDRLELALLADGGPGPARAPAQGSPEGLFHALGRAVLYAAKWPAEPEPGSLAAFAGLAEAVADALPAWQAPPPDIALLPGDRRYGIEFDALPSLVVTRHSSGSGPLPPWPEIRGYSAPACDGERARYQPSGAATGPGLLIAIPGFRLLTHKSLRVDGRFVRNSALANPAFVYHGSIASSRTLSPSLEWRALEPEAPAATLEAALLVVFATIAEGAREPYVLRLEAVLVRPLEGTGGEPIDLRIPLILLPEVEIGGGENRSSIARLAKEVAASLSMARAQIGPDGGKEEIALAIALSDRTLGPTPLARLGVRIPVPEDAGLPQSPS
jgi:hypothetical protein